ncbi:hypothetical protein A1A1_18432 [Planococcus antarcticus DSM 14505]|uniref:UbiD family decarboxylase n=1 Tax=Planococcus antarcticus DSM 14505 TaxID=1185653 RepID=A0AA87LSZ0_9BACL|nr:hypothetical protein [Planococcus antarcticus]EIM05010.1 hypothetical protein A1A1_18432 [Planococcus antarcticus DSM 14505]
MENKTEQYREKLAKLKDLPLVEKNIRVAGIVTEYVERKHPKIQLIVVGGLSVEYYTTGQYATVDIDFVATSHEQIMESLVELGFERQGKDSYLKELQVSVEIPDNHLEGSYEKVRDVLTDDGCIVHMISPEDIFCDRLRALVHWKEKEQLKWMTKLYEGNELDQDYIYSRLIGIKEKEVADVFFNTIKEQNK